MQMQMAFLCNQGWWYHEVRKENPPAQALMVSTCSATKVPEQSPTIACYQKDAKKSKKEEE
jgi:hypothetical protein